MPFCDRLSISRSKKRNSLHVRRSANALKGGVVARSHLESATTSPWYAFSQASAPHTRPPGPSMLYST